MLFTDDFLDKLNGTRHECGFPFHVNSGVRCTSYNEEIGGYKNSYHTQGRAADIKIDNGIDRAKIVSVALKHGLSVGVYRSFIHLDNRETQVVFYGGR